MISDELFCVNCGKLAEFESPRAYCRKCREEWWYENIAAEIVETINNYQDDTPRSLNILFSITNELYYADQFVKVDELLSLIPIANWSTQILIGVLTCTLCVRDKLQNRAKFCAGVREELEKREEDRLEELLKGLE